MSLRVFHMISKFSSFAQKVKLLLYQQTVMVQEENLLYLEQFQSLYDNML